VQQLSAPPSFSLSSSVTKRAMAARTAGRRALLRLASSRTAPLLSSALPQADSARALATVLPGWSSQARAQQQQQASQRVRRRLARWR
jgi:hypothetical protein